MLVTGTDGGVLGILTGHDVLGRITLAQRSLDTPIGEVMSQPVHTLTLRDRAHDAALPMSREGVRHVPITDPGRVVGIVFERDLFAPQRLSLRQLISRQARATPRFLKQMAADALSHRPPLTWRGGLGDEPIDLKLQGTAIFVEAARLMALATGVVATSTRQRLKQASAALGVPAAEASARVAGFEVLLLLRLGVQAGQIEQTNRCEVSSLNDFDRRVLRETMRVARPLQQRIELEWARCAGLAPAPTAKRCALRCLQPPPP